MVEGKKEKLDQIINKLLEHDRKFEEIESKSAKRHDEIIITLDKLMKEKEIAREDRLFAKSKDDEQDQRLVSLEGRIQKVEIKVGV